MRPGLPVFLLALAASLAVVDGLWLAQGHLAVDVAGYFRLCLLSAVLLAAARVYATLRPDPRLCAMLFGTGFLCLFSLEASILNYLLLTHTGPRIDGPLAAFDRALGFDWPAVMRFMAAHPLLNQAALLVYSSMLPQVALLTIVLGITDCERVYRFGAGLALSALICIAVWGFAPSFGAFSVYPPPPHMALALDWAYAQDLIRLLRDGARVISPDDARGLIGFPSYHAVLALLVISHAWRNAVLRWPALLLNFAVLAATPVQGGHHLADVLGAVPVTAATIFLVARLVHAEKYGKLPPLVNELATTGARVLTSASFRADAGQKPKRKAPAIKSKLSGVS